MVLLMLLSGRVRIGQPITGYGQETRNCAARQRIPNRIYMDENGIEQVEVNFYICGPHVAGKVFTEMFKDKTDNKWKYTYLIVQINSPSRAELMRESYLPAAETRPFAAINIGINLFLQRIEMFLDDELCFQCPQFDQSPVEL
ncbi:probable mitochondrial import inner membrane translocase subunit TIM21 [Hibiscus syriacus]|uniref:probable mitochondrial import inner membrane translocase subunit TIM21 n=1 Tax=Hibiscus syriacus TaxID=106335 RepID=UPI00192303C3|nr:probable mitochondrial import inner membrane translocase subunit TIM21 [Hibiscus syriacus]